MPRFIELEHLEKIDGWSSDALLALLDPVVFSFLGTVVFAVLGAQALYGQTRRISSEGARSVSVEWNLVFLAMFASLLPYGFDRDSLALVVQCLLRTPFYVVITWQLYKFHTTFTGFQWGLAAVMVFTTVASFVWPTFIATVLLWVSVVAAAHQPWKIWLTRSVQGVELRVLSIYLLSAVFWIVYGVALADGYIVSWAIGYAVVYTSGIIVYRMYQ